MRVSDTERIFFTGGSMPTLLLALCLTLNINNSCAGRLHKNVARVPPQSVDSILKPLLEQVDSSDEPTLRVFLRLKIASYLWDAPAAAPVKPETVAATALADLQAHEQEIPPLYVELFRRDLMALLK